jgi:hypothetical protein
MIASSEMFSKAVKVCIPLFSIYTQAKKIALSPPASLLAAGY